MRIATRLVNDDSEPMICERCYRNDRIRNKYLNRAPHKDCGSHRLPVEKDYLDAPLPVPTHQLPREAYVAVMERRVARGFRPKHPDDGKVQPVLGAEDFIERLKKLRVGMSLSRKQLEKCSGVPARAIQDYELGLAEPNAAALVALAKALCVRLGAG